MAAPFQPSPQPPRLAKLSPPRLFDVAPRERLFSRLDGLLAHPAVWLHGPPGAGKTTLAASYLDSRRRPLAWFQVDAGDADLATFYHYLTQLAPGFGLPAYTPDHAGEPAAFARRFFRSFFTTLAGGTLLVLDNLHEALGNADFSATLLAGLAEVPGHCRVMLVSRDEPPTPWARPVATGALAVLGGRELRLDTEEVTAITGCDAAGEAERLCAACDGWAAGLTLILAHGGGGAGDAGRAAMFDFLAGEILDCAEPVLQELLLRLWPLAQVGEEAARRLTGDPAGPALLDSLYRRNYFTERLAGAEPIYRFHPLFRQFLADQARRRLAPGRLSPLLATAATLLEEEGEWSDAIDLLLQAGDPDAAACLVLRAGPDALAQGRIDTLRGWIDALPAACRDESAPLQNLLGAAILPRAPAAARSAFVRAHALAPGDDPAALDSALGVIRATYAEWSDFSGLDPWLAEVDRLLPPGAPLERIASALAGFLYRQPRHPRLPRLAEEALIRLAEPLPAPERLAAGTFLLNHWNWKGDAGRARATIALVSPLLSDPGVSGFQRGWWHLRCAYHHFLAADAAATSAALAAAREIADQDGLPVVATVARLYQAFHHLGNNELAPAAATLAGLEERILPGRRLDRAIAAYLAGWLHLARQEAAPALARSREAVDLAETTGVPNVAAYFRLLEALACAQASDPRAAWAAWEAADAGVDGKLYPIFAFQSGCLGAWLAPRCGLPGQRAPLLLRALTLGATHDYANHLLWLPGPMAEVAAEALVAGIEPGYARRLIARRNLLPPAGAPAEWPWPIRIRSFGALAVERRGEPLHFQRKAQKKPLALLMALIAAGGREVSAATLAAQLWPDAEGDAGRSALTTTLFRLRHLLESQEAVILQDGKLSLDPRQVWLDAWNLESLAAAIARDPALPGAADGLLALYAGHFLEQEEDAPWLIAPRERFTRLFVAAVERLGGHLEGKGDLEAAAALYARGTAADPLAEALYRREMAALHGLGRPAEAMAVYRRCRQLLSVLIGAAPAAETEALRRRLG